MNNHHLVGCYYNPLYDSREYRVIQEGGLYHLEDYRTARTIYTSQNIRDIRKFAHENSGEELVWDVE